MARKTNLDIGKHGDGRHRELLRDFVGSLFVARKLR